MVEHFRLLQTAIQTQFMYVMKLLQTLIDVEIKNNVSREIRNMPNASATLAIDTAYTSGGDDGDDGLDKD